jgi:hypothetical protein
VDVLIAGPHVTVINPGANDGFPEGVIAEGTLAWHAPSRQWIIANDPSDATVAEVGGCSGGPDVIDLGHRVYWTC